MTGHKRGTDMELEAFIGRWRIERTISDRRDGRDGGFRGMADFLPDENGGLRYCEDGTLRLHGAAEMRATRTYFWEKAGPEIVVRFQDRRLFHSFDPNAERPAAHHDCPPDAYDVTYDFRRFPVWSALWNVEGPRKRLEIATTYTKAR
ncbi:MAG: DUF6314 family protein [Pseudomonadota bacterium]